MQYARSLLVGDEPPNTHAPSEQGPNGIHSLGPEHCQEVADTMRLLLQVPDQIHSAALLARAYACIDSVQGLRSRQLAIVNQNHREVFDLGYLVECVAVAGYLNAQQNLRQTLEMSLRVLCREPAMYESLHAILAMPRSCHPTQY